MYSCPNHIHLCVHFFWKTYLLGKSRIHIYTTHHILVYFIQKKFLTFLGILPNSCHPMPTRKSSYTNSRSAVPTVPGAARIEWHHWSSWLETFVGSLTLPGSQKAKNVAHPLKKKGGWNFEDVFFWGWTTLKIFCFDVVYPCLLPRQFWSGFKKQIYKQIEFSFGGGVVEVSRVGRCWVPEPFSTQRKNCSWVQWYNTTLFFFVSGYSMIPTFECFPYNPYIWGNYIVNLPYMDPLSLRLCPVILYESNPKPLEFLCFGRVWLGSAWKVETFYVKRSEDPWKSQKWQEKCNMR